MSLHALELDAALVAVQDQALQDRAISQHDRLERPWRWFGRRIGPQRTRCQRHRDEAKTTHRRLRLIFLHYSKCPEPRHSEARSSLPRPHRAVIFDWE